MIDLWSNPVFQILVILLIGFLLGVITGVAYMFRFLKIPIMKFITMVCAKLKTTDISFKQFLRSVIVVLDKSIEEIEHESERTNQENKK